jgi:hypothetical protein
VRSTGRLITDIWRTGSRQSKRFGAPLAVADGDVIRSLGRDGERQGFRRRGNRACSSPATGHRLVPCPANPCEADRPAGPYGSRPRRASWAIDLHVGGVLVDRDRARITWMSRAVASHQCSMSDALCPGANARAPFLRPSVGDPDVQSSSAALSALGKAASTVSPPPGRERSVREPVWALTIAWTIDRPTRRRDVDSTKV